MKDKKVSVIIPFYNGVEWLCEAVQSVLEQTYDNIEIIVVNDGSPEDITSFLDKYGDKIIYRYQENQGAAVARNLGMSVATGDYLAYEDADDIWLPTKLEKQISFMEKNSLMWSHTGYYYWWPDSGRMLTFKNTKDYGDVKEQLYVGCKIATPSVVVSRKTMIEHPEIVFPPELRKGQDAAYYKQLSQFYYLALVQEPLVKVRVRGKSSFLEVLRRFDDHAKDYRANKDSLPPTLKLTGKIYVFYNKLFGTKRGKIKEFIAQCFRVLPYSIERIYLKRLTKRSNKEERYICRITESE